VALAGLQENARIPQYVDDFVDNFVIISLLFRHYVAMIPE
jgi:hypothetical protein